MKLNIDIVLCYFLIVVYLRSVTCTGCISLDTFSFDKLLSKFKATLVKFDSAYPYGVMQEEYEKLCRGSREINSLLVAEVPIKDYGEKDNFELADKYGLDKNDFPVVKLFVEGKEKPVDFEFKEQSDFTEENLRLFVRKHSDVYIGLTGCLEEFDDIAEEFISTKDVATKKKLLLKATQLSDKTVSDAKKKSAEVYVKYMRKMIEFGDAFVKHESLRIKNIVSQKVSDNKKEELEKKINILRVFNVKDEL